MNRYRKSTSMVALIALVVALGTSVASANSSPLPGVDPNLWIRIDPNGPWRFPNDWQDHYAEEIYRKDGAEVVPWTKETALPSPDNAALQYYQAFLLRWQPDDATFPAINNVLTGGEPDGKVRAYLGDCRAMIHTVEVASRIPQCTWGVRYFDRSGFSVTTLLGEIRQLALVFALDARTLGADGHYDAALARCLTMRRLARHTGDDTMLTYLVSRTIDDLARRTMQYVLGLLPPDVDILEGLRGQLAVVPGTPTSFEKAVQADLELIVEFLRQDHNTLEWIRQQMDKTGDGQQKTQAVSLTDEEILAHARETCLQSLNGIFQRMDSDMPYEQKYAQIDEGIRARTEQYSGDPAAKYLWLLVSGRMVERYNLFVRDAAGYNALKTAVEVYLARAQTGQLPQTLPAYTSKDPFSGQDFEYEITEKGFLLRCRAQDLHEKRIWQYEFNVAANPKNP